MASSQAVLQSIASTSQLETVHTFTKTCSTCGIPRKLRGLRLWNPARPARRPVSKHKSAITATDASTPLRKELWSEEWDRLVAMTRCYEGGGGIVGTC